MAGSSYSTFLSMAFQEGLGRRADLAENWPGSDTLDLRVDFPRLRLQVLESMNWCIICCDGGRAAGFFLLTL